MDSPKNICEENLARERETNAALTKAIAAAHRRLHIVASDIDEIAAAPPSFFQTQDSLSSVRAGVRLALAALTVEIPF